MAIGFCLLFHSTRLECIQSRKGLPSISIVSLSRFDHRFSLFAQMHTIWSPLIALQTTKDCLFDGAHLRRYAQVLYEHKLIMVGLGNIWYARFGIWVGSVGRGNRDAEIVIFVTRHQITLDVIIYLDNCFNFLIVLQSRL